MSDLDARVCDRRRVGLVIEREGMVLLAAPDRFPAGYAPLDGHCDGLDMHSAARSLCTRLGLCAPVLRGAAEGWRPDLCERPGRAGDERERGHQWLVYRVGGQGTPCGRQGRGRLLWWSRTQLQDAADRTVAYAHDAIRDGAWRVLPGLSPVWVGWLAKLGIVKILTERDRKVIADLTAALAIGGVR